MLAATHSEGMWGVRESGDLQPLICIVNITNCKDFPAEAVTQHRAESILVDGRRQVRDRAGWSRNEDVGQMAGENFVVRARTEARPLGGGSQEVVFGAENRQARLSKLRKRKNKRLCACERSDKRLVEDA